MSDLWLIESLATAHEPILRAEFDFFIRDVSDRAEAQILQYYWEYEDMVVSPLMLDAFEHDVRAFVDEVVVRVGAEPEPDPLKYLEPLIATAREHRAFVWIMGD